MILQDVADDISFRARQKGGTDRWVLLLLLLLGYGAIPYGTAPPRHTRHENDHGDIGAMHRLFRRSTSQSSL